jgi:hypothetical protein
MQLLGFKKKKGRAKTYLVVLPHFEKIEKV